ncbi:hypothetical protein BH11PLA2_BH11PLA2_25470 [soil metagenome]
MTPELPNDLKAWPADDFEILGVSRTAADDDIRRAYTRLIRRFKPEHFPEHFQRIREAYDTCRMQSQLYRMIPEKSEEPEATAPEAGPSVVLPTWSPPVTVEMPLDAVDLLWQQAVSGDLETAYTGLVKECKSSERQDLPLRLYWLLNLEPGLDTDRTRHHWLEEALMRSRLAGPAAELYRRELEIDPKTALLDTYFDVLGIDAEPVDLLAMARSRIQAAGRDERFVVLERDLNRVKPRIGIDGEIAWLALIVNASEWAACSPAAAELRSTCEREMKALEYLALQHSYFFDRVDECENWRSNSYTRRWHGSMKDYVQLIHQGWAGYGSLSAEQLRIGLAEIVREPSAAISRLDHLFRQDRPELQLYALSMLVS